MNAAPKWLRNASSKSASVVEVVPHQAALEDGGNVWIFTTAGFFAVCQKPGDDHLTISARWQQDLASLRKYMPELSPTVTETGGDFPCHARINPVHFAAGLARLGIDIDYPDLRAEVWSADRVRAQIYERISSLLRALADAERKELLK